MYRVFSNRLASAQNLQLIGAHLRLMSSCQKNLVDRIIRVDHAGELGADRIYAGQYAVLKKTSVGSLIKEMWEEEKHHRETFEKLMVQHRARPTALLPIWNVAGFVLGAGTALMGKEAAMACTVAVEDVIGHHYNAQIRDLVEDDPVKHEELLKIIKKFRDDELHHYETGLEHDAEQAPFYKTLTEVIKVGCKGAIWLSERI
ncbi:5-demethoxyubiquinone hydroxylase, mitochondrial [Octopus bimaculoides]|uniref:5-demethoxyubiquinone hydroxylase, mitochondrial n=1 Tax=Octopus bimaculoides TaxID=37653 RepID=A0A0L8FG56_OCTBM|nr:5-demethoxyubiquinone hydroxylase, mitochondrial [Octopus bimaculoides]XP_014790277.1 5-demethoxyubiquinone hydroxylase, mitochondrial [Octopus bimaculoides]|eukprot:XP_014790276.1 PREDICTED: 5-demethoxyubiquinone hydroxylase, mitochondrial-like [Octopus bimaculoides]